MDESEEYIDMCKAIQDMREEAMQAGKQEGQQLKEKEIIIQMLNKKIFTYEEIAEIVRTSVKKVKEAESEMLNIK